MKIGFAALATFAIVTPIAGCGGDSKPVSTKTVTQTQSTVELPASPINNMRKTLDSLGVPCLNDSDWYPAADAEYEGADTAGMCGKDGALIATFAGDGRGPLFLAVRAKARDQAAGGGNATVVVRGEGWYVLTDKNTALNLQSRKPGSEIFEN